MVKREFGKDAVILSSEEMADGTVEIVAAIDMKSTPTKTVSSAPTSDEITALKEELSRLREELYEMKKTGYELKLPEKKRKLLKHLLDQSIKEEFAIRLCEKASDLDSLYNLIEKELSIYNIEDSRKIVLLVGSTGVGKTTTLCKLAAESVRKNKKIAIVTLDTYRLGASYQLAAFCRVLGLPFEVAHNTAEFREHINKYKNRDQIFVDTTGKNPKDKNYIEDLKEIYSLDLPIETHLILSASSDQDFMIESYQSFKDLNIDCLGFTKIDEVTKKGCIYNLSLIYQKPIAYLTNGQSIPKDIIFPDSTMLSKLIIQKEY